MMNDFNDSAKIVIDVLNNLDARSFETGIKPNDLFEKCDEFGLTDEEEIESVIVDLIDKDIIDYEMNDETEIVSVWLLYDPERLDG